MDDWIGNLSLSDPLDRAMKLHQYIFSVVVDSCSLAQPLPPIHPGPSVDAALGYEWAVVSGGAPKYVSNSRCSTFNSIFPTTWQYQGGEFQGDG